MFGSIIHGVRKSCGCILLVWYRSWPLIFHRGIDILVLHGMNAMKPFASSGFSLCTCLISRCVKSVLLWSRYVRTSSYRWWSGEADAPRITSSHSSLQTFTRADDPYTRSTRISAPAPNRKSSPDFISSSSTHRYGYSLPAGRCVRSPADLKNAV